MSTKIISLMLFLAVSVNINAQHQKLQNLPYTDRRIFHLGFTLGLHTQDLILAQSGLLNENGEVWFSEIPKYSPGFAVGLIGDVFINNHLNLRLVPTLYLGDKLFVFKEQFSAEEFRTRIRNDYLSIPLHFKLSARRTDNFRPYLLMGVYTNLELTQKKDLAVLLKQQDYGVEFGIGCNLYLPMFKLAPELKFSFGLIDILERERVNLKEEELLKYSNSISRASTRMITLSLNFE